MNSDIHYLKQAIASSKASVEQGRFPAGALLVVDSHETQATFSGISGNAADYRHVEVRAIENAAVSLKQPLKNAVLYASMEPCLMCLTTAYWAGISKIVYAISRKSVPTDYYESTMTANDLASTLHRKVELVHIPELEEEATAIVIRQQATREIVNES